MRRKHAEAELQAKYVALEVGKIIAHMLGAEPTPTASSPSVQPQPDPLKALAAVGVAPPPPNAAAMTAEQFWQQHNEARARFHSSQ